MKKIALVTGANRGLGLEVVRELGKQGLHLILTSRDASKGEKAAADLRSQGLAVDFHPLDVADAKSIDSVYSYVMKTFGRLDVLVNNAGILLDQAKPGVFEHRSAFEVAAETVLKTFSNNTLGAYQLCQKFLPVMMKQGYGRVVNVSSGMGQLSEMNSGYPAYRISKTALNAVTKCFSEETKNTGVLVNSVCPGWVRTEMGGKGATKTVEQGADTIVWLATLPEGGPSGQFFRDRKPISW